MNEMQNNSVTPNTSNKKHFGWRLNRKERSSYYFYFFGQNVFYWLVTSFLATYMTLMGVSPLYSAGIILGVKVWDAVNDVLFGFIFDKVKFKHLKGKFMPWIRISIGLIPITTVLMFANQAAFSETMKLVWMAIFYVCWDTAYTLCDTPVFAMVNTMTDNFEERTTLVSYSRIASSIGGFIPGTIGAFLISEKVGLSFFNMALIVSIVGFLAMIPLVIFGKEYNLETTNKEENFSLKAMFKYLFQNKYLLLYFLFSFLHGALNTSGALSMLVSFYLFNNALFTTIIGLITGIPAIILNFFVPKIIKKVDKKKLLIISQFIYVILTFITYFCGYNNQLLFLILVGLKTIPGSLVGVLLFMFLPDCAEYGKFKSGIDAKGITFAIQTFNSKLTAAVSSWLALFVVGLFGYIAVEASDFGALKELFEAGKASQTPLALSGLWITYTLIPAIGDALSIIPFIFYKLKDKDVKIIMEANENKITHEEALVKIGHKL